LVENALDAQATRISIEIQAGGRSLIRVTDDGLGMSRDDALLCLERHATSKIQSAADLHAVQTMGFRGEAIPSIASVSRFTLTTRERDPEPPAATQIVIHSGKILEVKAAGAPPGTCVEVRQLFFNVPVRRKFLRSEETERAHIQHYLTLAALAHPAVAFVFHHDNRLLWQLAPRKPDDGPTAHHDALRERLRALEGDEQLLPVDFTGERAAESEAQEPPRPVVAVRVWGFIGAPGVSRATRDSQHLFVNRRPVENRGLNFALVEGYHTALMKGRYPVGCLFLELDPAEVDVNIHPAKREVKFHQERAVRHCVAQAVRQALLNFHLKSTPPSAHAQGQISPASTGMSSPTPTRVAFSPGPPGPADFPQLEAARSPNHPLPSVSGHLPPPLGSRPPSPPSVPPVASPLSPAANSSAPVAPADAVPLLAVPLRLLGVIGKLYVVFESDRGLVLLDQHAAHERVLYEQMLRNVESGHAPSQRLLLPETLELPPRDAQFLREQLPTLTRLGVGLSEFGEHTFLLDALPPFVKAGDARRFVLEVIDELKASGQSIGSWRLGEPTVAKTVCRHAVKANDPLAEPELENLVHDLRRCAMPYTCPHGRPTLLEMSFRELEKKFGRIQ
ncbi:MAG: DNA mismatch repair endonuclease MutL, partial [Verrucomicrobia bacterium]|nr:DNA mismatch repair endonuclease MutL [Verrucomicrobiota bacterium]